MIGWLRERTRLRRHSEALYSAIVAQSRHPTLFEHCGVPDTMDGRLEMILLHVVIVLDRLKAEGEEGQRLGQRLIENLVADMDDALRRIGIGDDGVAGRMPKLAGALRERAADYGLALEPGRGGKSSVPKEPTTTPNGALEAAILEHVYAPRDALASASAIPLAKKLAHYVRTCRDELALAGSEDLLAGEARFPVPE